MTDMASRPNWLRWRRQSTLDPSPIPQASAETTRIAAEVARVVDQLRRMNDLREAKFK